MRRLSVVLAMSALVLASCGQDEPEPAAQEPEVATMAIEASDYKFSGAPATTQSGEFEITLSNAGKEPHQAQLFKMNDGVEIAQLVEKGKAPEAERDFSELGTWAGGPNAVDAGETQVAVAQLEAGNYAFFCQVPDAKGQSHLALGMVAPLEVIQADDEAEAPSADFSSTGTEFTFELPEEWTGTIAFENRGEQAHELQVIGVAEGKTPEDVDAWFKAEPGTAGPPSWTTGGGVAVIDPGDTRSFEADIGPGTYFAMCFVADPEKKAPHFALGMMQRFEVQE